MKRFFLSLIGVVIVLGSIAQLQSPDQFLGYQLGTRFTPHFKIVNYLQYVAKARPDVVRLLQYGETNEQRPLYVIFVSSAKNIGNLENIRENNLALAHMTGEAGSTDSPAIVWLSYNVHGNEAVSSEAAMETLFTLANQADEKTKQWLNNTVVVIDPCENPDGRDRYVNWYNTVVGKKWNPNPTAREHREDWPGGRSNHYNYDLNRDWAWQTQVESQQRVSLYNKWLPQVHIDFHEQEYNSPYFFPPAAAPFHEVITQWQRDFQILMGKNHVQYFDKNGWLFFTHEEFDLFYPSYGDTYPIYNGSIGFTYEQGGISAGLGVKTHDGDTLTLVDRLAHHYTTGISTVETSSRNSERLVKEFQKFFDDAVNGKVGTYKTYIIKNKPGDEQRIRSLMKLLDRVGIRYGVSAGSGKGYNYHTQKEEAFSISKNDLVISGTQPKAVLTKVLFEPQSKLVDSITYDITAWALPYAYGLTAFATNQNFRVTEGKVFDDFTSNLARDSYAYAIKWQGLQSVRAVGELLQKGVRLRCAELPFESGGEKFDRGTVIVSKNGNERFADNLWQIVSNVCNGQQITLYPVQSGMMEKGSDLGSGHVHIIKRPKVALLTGEGVDPYSAGEIWDYFDNQINYPITLLKQKDFDRLNLHDFTVLIMTSGNYDFLKQEKSAGVFENWLREGGKVIALEGAVSQLAGQKWSVMKLKTDTTDKKSEPGDNPYKDLQTFENRERDAITNNIPGAIYKVDVDNTHPLVFGYPGYYYTLKLDPNVYEFIKEGKGWNVGYLKKENYLSGFVGYKLKPKLKDGVLYAVQNMRRGAVIYLTDDIIFRNFWQNGKLMLANAVFLVGE